MVTVISHLACLMLCLARDAPRVPRGAVAHARSALQCWSLAVAHVSRVSDCLLELLSARHVFVQTLYVHYEGQEMWWVKTKQGRT